MVSSAKKHSVVALKWFKRHCNGRVFLLKLNDVTAANHCNPGTRMVGAGAAVHGAALTAWHCSELRKTGRVIVRTMKLMC